MRCKRMVKSHFGGSSAQTMSTGHSGGKRQGNGGAGASDCPLGSCGSGVRGVCSKTNSAEQKEATVRTHAGVKTLDREKKKETKQ